MHAYQYHVLWYQEGELLTGTEPQEILQTPRLSRQEAAWKLYVAVCCVADGRVTITSQFLGALLGDGQGT